MPLKPVICCDDFLDTWQLGIIGFSKDYKRIQIIRPKHVDETNSLCAGVRINIKFCPFCGTEVQFKEE